MRQLGWVVCWLLAAAPALAQGQTGEGLLVAEDAANAAPPEFFVVSAGNNLGLPDEPALKFAEDDASELGAILNRLGGVAPLNTALALGDDATTLRRVVLETNARIRARAHGGSSAVLLVYYSGHADARGLHLGDTILPFDELKAMVEGSSAQVRILILDACRSGGVTRVKGALPAEEFEIRLDNRLNAEGLAVVTSSAAGEDSYESDQLRASFFSHHLLQALRGAADSDRDGRVTLNEAYRYTYGQTLRSSGQTLKLQHPTYQYDIKGKGELTLTNLTNDRDRSGRLLIPASGTYLVFEGDENGQVAAEVTVGEKGSRLVLPAGRYFVQQRARAHYVEYRVELKPGQEADLAALEHRTVEYARLLRKGGGERNVIHGLYLLGASRGPINPGEPAVAHWLVGTSVDFPWLSFGLRLRYARSHLTAADSMMRSTHDEIGLG